MGCRNPPSVSIREIAKLLAGRSVRSNSYLYGCPGVDALKGEIIVPASALFARCRFFRPQTEEGHERSRALEASADVGHAALNLPRGHR